MSLRAWMTSMLTWSAFTVGWGASFMPPVSNFGAWDYHAGYQNWACTQGPGGEMLFGNNDGMLEYDGYRWELTRVPGGFNIRSIKVIGDRVYVGTYEDFGYFSRDGRHQWVYTSLRAEVPDFVMDNSEIWSIVEQGDKVLFQSFGCWFIYDGARVHAHAATTEQPLFFFDVRGEAYAQIINGDFKEIDSDGTMNTVVERSAMGNDHVVAVIEGEKTGSLILCTENHGLWTLENGEVAAMTTDVDDALRRQQLNRAIRLRDGTLALGTVQGGVYALTLQGKLLYHFHRDNSLQNNTVLGLSQDDEGNVWVALDIGVAQVKWNSPVEILRPDVCQPAIGMVYGVTLNDGLYYVATNQGLYAYMPERGTFELQHGTEGQCWFVRELGGELWAGTNQRLLRKSGTQWKPVLGDASTSLLPLRGAKTDGSGSNEGGIFVSTYATPVILGSSEGAEPRPLRGVSAPLMKAEQAGDGTIWASHKYDGALQLQLPNGYGETKVRRVRSLSEQGRRGAISVFKLDDTLVLADADSAYTYIPTTGAIEPYEPLNALLPAVRGVKGALPLGHERYLLGCDGGYVVVDATQPRELRMLGRISKGMFDNPGFGLTPTAELEREELALLNLNNGIARYRVDDKSLKERRTVRHALTMHSLTSSSTDGVNHVYALDTEAQIPSSEAIMASVSLPHFDHLPMMFHYTLSDEGSDRVIESELPMVNYGSLSPGRHVLKVEAYSDMGELLGQTGCSFRVLSPWYRSKWAVGGYLLLFAALILGLSHWQKVRTTARRRHAYELQRQHDALVISEQERQIALQQQQLLQGELQTKGKEIATASLGMLAKSEALASLRERVQQYLTKGQCGRRSMEALLGDIDSNAETEEFWKLYQDNFDLIHEHFFRTLRERYPALTATDLRFCALLRLNFSTKEIARMTSLTVRGVETARLRLRRKITDLPTGSSLVEFLISIK